MPTFRGFDEFAKALDRSVVELQTTEKRRITRDLGKRAQRIAEKEARSDLGGDVEMSGWPRAALNTRIKTDAPGATVLLPRSRLAAAGWTVANDGRNVGETGLSLGPGMNHRTGQTSRTKKGNVRRRGFRAKRWNGVARGKGTADRARDVMESEFPRVVDAGVKKALRKRFDVT